MPLLVARRPLPGAAPSGPRLPGVVPRPGQPAPMAGGGPDSVPAPRVGGVERAAVTSGRQVRPSEPAPTTSTSTREPVPTAPAVAVKPVRFSLAVVQSAGFLWLETLASAGLSAPQQQLLTAMAVAVEGRTPALQEKTFDWPLHDNPQLDRSAAAAAAALGGFLQRLLAERPCRGICLLGDDAPLGLVTEEAGVPLLRLPSTRAMLEEPLRKREAWRVLSPLRSARV